MNLRKVTKNMLHPLCIEQTPTFEERRYNYLETKGKIRKGLILIYLLVATLLPDAPLYAGEKILFVYYHDYAPFGWAENGKMKGIYIDIVSEAFTKRLGIPVEHRGYPWKRAQKMVREGKADGYCTTVTPERLSYSLATEEPVLDVHFKIYAAIDSPRLEQLKNVKSISDLRGFKLTDYSGSGWAEENLSSLDIQWLPTNEQIWKFLIEGRADAAVKNEWTTRYVLKELGYQDQIVELPHAMTREPTTFHIFLGKKSSFRKYLGQLNEVIIQMREDGTLDRIYDKYR